LNILGLRFQTWHYSPETPQLSLDFPPTLPLGISLQTIVVLEPWRQVWRCGNYWMCISHFCPEWVLHTSQIPISTLGHHTHQVRSIQHFKVSSYSIPGMVQLPQGNVHFSIGLLEVRVVWPQWLVIQWLTRIAHQSSYPGLSHSILFAATIHRSSTRPVTTDIQIYLHKLSGVGNLKCLLEVTFNGVLWPTTLGPFRASNSAFVVRIRKIWLLIDDDGDVVGPVLSELWICEQQLNGGE